MDNNKLSRKSTQDDFVTEKIDIIKNNLLGDYDDNGKYFISPQIVGELLDMKKIKKTSFGNSMFCIGELLGYGEIVFELFFDGKTDSDSQACAHLYVLESVDKINGYLQNTIKTKIAEYRNSLERFIENSYEHFHIYNSSDDIDDEEGMERKINDEINEDSFILAKKQYLLMLNKLSDEKFLDAYGKYFTYRISTLTTLNNDFSKAVLDKFNEEYALIEKVFLNGKNYKILNELLDKCIEEMSGTNEVFVEQEKEYNEKIAPALDNFVESINKLNEKYENKALNMLDKDDREKVEELIDAQEEHNRNNDNEEDMFGDTALDDNAITPQDKVADIESLGNQTEEIPVIPSILSEDEEKPIDEIDENSEDIPAIIDENPPITEQLKPTTVEEYLQSKEKEISTTVSEGSKASSENGTSISEAGNGAKKSDAINSPSKAENSQIPANSNTPITEEKYNQAYTSEKSMTSEDSKDSSENGASISEAGNNDQAQDKKNTEPEKEDKKDSQLKSLNKLLSQMSKSGENIDNPSVESGNSSTTVSEGSKASSENGTSISEAGNGAKKSDAINSPSKAENSQIPANSNTPITEEKYNQAYTSEISMTSEGGVGYSSDNPENTSGGQEEIDKIQENSGDSNKGAPISDGDGRGDSESGEKENQGKGDSTIDIINTLINHVGTGANQDGKSSGKGETTAMEYLSKDEEAAVSDAVYYKNEIPAEYGRDGM